MSQTATIAQTNGIKLKELKFGFGAEIRGLDFVNGVSEDSFRLIEDAVTKVSSQKKKSCQDTVEICGSCSTSMELWSSVTPISSTILMLL
jgi:hypothetical protein